MFAGTFALLFRSLRADAQRPIAHRARLAAVVVILIMLMVASASGGQGAVPGLTFFRLVSQLGLVLILLAGLGYFVTAITEEKEEGTLGLLLLADLSPISILLGKSTNRIVSAWLMFLAQFPFALLALTLGGITLRQIAATYIALALFLFLVANLALLASVCSRKGTSAAALLICLLFLVLGFVPWLRYQLKILSGTEALLSPAWGTWGDELFELYKMVSIWHRLDEILQPRYQGGLWGLQATASLVGGVAAFIVAWVVFRRTIWEVDATTPTRVQGDPKSGGRWLNLVPRPGRQPLVWKDFHFLLGGYHWWGFKLVLLVLAWGLIRWRAEWVQALTWQSPLQALANGLFLLGALELLYACSQMYHTEQKEGTLCNLLMLPRSAGLISYHKLGGCLWGLLPTWGLALLVGSLDDAPQQVWPLFTEMGTVFPVGIFLILCHLTVLCSLYVKWGAVAMALGILAIVSTIVIPVAGTMMELIRSGEHNVVAQIAPAYYMILTVCGGLQVAILFRLEEIAGR